MCMAGKACEAIDVIDADGRTTKIECDALAVSGGWNPAVHLTCHLGGKPVWNEQLAAFVPGAVPPGMHVAGAANGALTLAECLTPASRPARWRRSNAAFRSPRSRCRARRTKPSRVAPLWHVKESRAKAFVDFQNDVTVKDIALANQEGFCSVEARRHVGRLQHLVRERVLDEALDRPAQRAGAHRRVPALLDQQVLGLLGAARAAARARRSDSQIAAHQQVDDLP